MPGTDGPGQFPDHNHIANSLVQTGHGIFTRRPRPKPECGIIVESLACRLSGELFFLLLPHIPTHTVSESPNVP